MKTNALAQTRLVALLTAGAENTNDGSAVTRPELAAAYEEFALLLATLSDDGDTLPHTLRCLYYTRTELHALQRSLCCEAKKNLPTGDYLLRALELVEAEIELQKTLFPELHARSTGGGGSGDPDQPALNSIGRTPDGPIIRWMLSHHALLELATALHACDAFADAKGRKPTFTELMRCLCHAFNITVADIYVKRTQMFDRCTNQTPFLDKLKNAFIQIINNRLK